jgi:RNA polymerase sigma-70 factor (ECF subfamily)
MAHIGLLRKKPEQQTTPESRSRTDDDDTLLRALLRARTAGEQSRRWRELCRRFEPLIATCVARTLRRYGAWAMADLHDLVNDAWVALLRDDLRKLRQYDARRGYRLTSFIGLVATNITIDHLRMPRAEHAPLDGSLEELLATRSEPPPDALEQRQEVARARAAVGLLSRADRALFACCVDEEQPPEVIARDWGVSVNTIYSRKSKLRQRLLELLRSKGP